MSGPDFSQFPEVRAMVGILRQAARDKGVPMAEVVRLFGDYPDPRGLVLVCQRLDLEPLDVLAAGKEAGRS